MIDSSWFMFTISREAVTYSVAADLQYNVPTYAAATTGILADLPPASAEQIATEGGDFSRVYRTLILLPTQALTKGDRITCTDSPGDSLNNTVWYVHNEPQVYPHPLDGTEHHKEAMVVKSQD